MTIFNCAIAYKHPETNVCSIPSAWLSTYIFYIQYWALDTLFSSIIIILLLFSGVMRLHFTVAAVDGLSFNGYCMFVASVVITKLSTAG